MMDSFNSRWAALVSDAGDDFDERDAFDKLLDEVNALADSAIDYDLEGGPGQSSACAIYHVSSNAKAKSALGQFSRGEA